MGCWGRGGTVPAMWETKPQEKCGLREGIVGYAQSREFWTAGHFLADDLAAEETDLVCELVLKRPGCGQCRYTAPPGKRVALFLPVKKGSGSCTEIRLKQHFRPVGVFPAVLGESSGASGKATSGLQLRRGSVTGAGHCQLLGSALAAAALGLAGGLWRGLSHPTGLFWALFFTTPRMSTVQSPGAPAQRSAFLVPRFLPLPGQQGLKTWSGRAFQAGSCVTWMQPRRQASLREPGRGATVCSWAPLCFLGPRGSVWSLL